MSVTFPPPLLPICTGPCFTHMLLISYEEASYYVSIQHKGEREDSLIRWPLAIIIRLTFDVIEELFDITRHADENLMETR